MFKRYIRLIVPFVLFMSPLANSQWLMNPYRYVVVDGGSSEFAFLEATSKTRDMDDVVSYDTLKIDNKSLDSNQTCLVATVGIFDWSDVEINSVHCADNSNYFILEVVEEDGNGEEAGIWYLLDTDMPSSDSVTVVVTSSATPDFAWGLLFYSGVDQTTPFENPDSTQNCGWNSISTVTGSTTMSWSWTNNTCHIHCVTTILGDASGSEAIDMLLSEAVGTSHTIGGGQTQNWMQEDISGLDCDGMSSRE